MISVKVIPQPFFFQGFCVLRNLIFSLAGRFPFVQLRVSLQKNSVTLIFQDKIGIYYK